MFLFSAPKPKVKRECFLLQLNPDFSLAELDWSMIFIKTPEQVHTTRYVRSSGVGRICSVEGLERRTGVSIPIPSTTTRSDSNNFWISVNPSNLSDVRAIAL